MTTKAILALEDGTVFEGNSIGAQGRTVGEVVFNTAMTGYQEILTDPSYCQQIVLLTHPHIGNVGVNDVDIESADLPLAGLIVKALSPMHSNWRARGSLPAYLAERGKIGIAGIDTRQLTRMLRNKGAMKGCIIAGPSADAAECLRLARAFEGIEGKNLAATVTTAEPYAWTDGDYHLDRGEYPRSAGTHRVVVVDFGVKRAILHKLADLGCEVRVLPANASAREIMNLNPDGIVLSNGPGDPQACDHAIKTVKLLLDEMIPMFGICLGHQILALAAGAKTVKMKFGHHGANHPVVELKSSRVFITSQNHGFAVDELSLPQGAQVTHRSLFDGTVQGISLSDRPAFGFQGHPEASPGPLEIGELFVGFVNLMRERKSLLATAAIA